MTAEEIRRAYGAFAQMANNLIQSGGDGADIFARIETMHAIWEIAAQLAELNENIMIVAGSVKDLRRSS